MTVEITSNSLALQVILQVVLLSSALAYAGQIAVLVDVSGHSDPPLAGNWPVCTRIQPSILYASNHGKGEHCRTGGLWPCFFVIDQFPPHSVLPLVLEQRGHHR